MDNFIKDKSLATGLMAAGSSQRFGKENKLFSSFGPGYLFESALGTLSTINPLTHIVCGFEAQKLKSTIKSNNVFFLENKDYQQGLSSSLKTFIQYVENNKEYSAALIHFADLPWVTSEDLRNLINSFNNNPSMVHVAGFEETFGPPLILPRMFFKSFLEQVSQQGAKKWLKAQPHLIVDTPNAGKDIDFPTDIV